MISFLCDINSKYTIAQLESEENITGKNRRLLSLTTDFGIQDYYQAKFKAAVYRQCPNVEILDVSHAIPLHDISLASYQLKNILQEFPDQSIHLVAVNNYYSESPKYIVFSYKNQFFVGPDNGIFSLVFPNLDQLKVYEIQSPDHGRGDASTKYLHAISCIFHHLPFEEFAIPTHDLVLKIDFKPVITSTQLRATVIHIDHFGNVVTNLSKSVFDDARNGRQFKLYYDPHDPLEYISKSYGSAGIGDPLCLFNETGLLEIAIYMGNAAQLLNLKINETIQIDFV